MAVMAFDSYMLYTLGLLLFTGTFLANNFFIFLANRGKEKIIRQLRGDELSTFHDTSHHCYTNCTCFFTTRI